MKSTSDNTAPHRTRTLTIAELCTLNDISVVKAERALASLQEKGLVSGYVTGDLLAPITVKEAASKYFE